MEDCRRDPIYFVFWFLLSSQASALRVVHTYDFFCSPCFSQWAAFIRLTRLVVTVSLGEIVESLTSPLARRIIRGSTTLIIGTGFLCCCNGVASFVRKLLRSGK